MKTFIFRYATQFRKDLEFRVAADSIQKAKTVFWEFVPGCVEILSVAEVQLMTPYEIGYRAASENNGECPFYPGTRSESEFNEGFCAWLEQRDKKTKKCED